MSVLAELTKEYKKLGIGDQINFDKLYLYSIITHSTAIEGSTVSETENKLLFDEGISANKPIAEQMMNLDLKKAYEEGMKLASDHTDYSIEMFCSLSALVMKNTGSDYNTILGSFSSSNGDLRLINVSAGRGGKSYMAWQKVPERLEEFCTWLNKERAVIDPGDIKKIYELSFLAHYNLVYIHPWADGNGRMARLVMNMIQNEFGMIPSIVKKEHRADYIDSLALSQEAKDPLKFIGFMMNEHIENLKDNIKEYKESINDDTLIVELDTINNTLNLTEKEAIVIDIIKKNANVTIEELISITGFSRPTITRAISTLKQKGVLERVGAKKNGNWKIMK